MKRRTFLRNTAIGITTIAGTGLASLNNQRQDMKKPPDSPTFAQFTAAMQTIMKVPKTAIQTEKKRPSK